MSPPLKHKSAVKWIVFDTESERGPSPAGSLGATPADSTDQPTPAESKLKQGVISWVREGKSVPYLVVTPQYGADMSASDFAKEILETVGRAGGGEGIGGRETRARTRHHRHHHLVTTTHSHPPNNPALVVIQTCRCPR